MNIVAPASRRQFLARTAALSGALVVGFRFAPAQAAGSAALAPRKAVAKNLVESFVALGPDGDATIHVGKVDLGTGTRTALAQLAAEELDLPFERITLVMGDTGTTPDQWITGANLTIAQGGTELRRACATARAMLLERAAARLGVPATELLTADGAVRARSGDARLTYAQLVAGQPLALQVDEKAVLKKAAECKVIGQSIRRVDIPGKVTGEFTYVHDFRLPGMLHARVLRPEDLGAPLLAFDDGAARKVRGFVRTVRKGDFLAVVARDEWAAIKAMRAMKTQWGPGTGLPDPATVFDHWRSRPLAKQDVTQKVGDVDAALAAAPRKLKARYDFAVQTHASSGPSCAVARVEGGELTVWTASQATHSLVSELAPIVGLPPEKIRCVYLEGSGCYGRNGHEDAAADAALIATLTGQPVRVQWMRDDETARAPKSPPRSMDFEAALDGAGNITAWNGDFWIALNHIVAFKPLDFPLLSATETGLPKPGNWVGFLFQNSGIGYALPNVRVNTRHVEQAFFRSAHLRSPGRIENSFANESFIDELAFAAQADPAEFRLRHLKDARGVAVLRKALERAGWQSRVGLNPGAGAGDIARGRGVAYLRYNNSSTYVAAVAEVAVNRRSGEIRVERVSVAHDCGQVVNPDGTVNQVEGGVIQTVSRTLMEQVRWDRSKVLSRDWVSYPILRHDQVPKVLVDLIDRPGEPSTGAGEPTACAIPGAIGNAVFDATGARLRAVPFTPEQVLAALARPVAA
ncbi:molybdopterin-dependent oxidoreductase [Ramlibacter sp. XY19]|uniref:xanthine dehydrogenase family protein molybdopterin-binding subunit n=1 Tax=Ramlibacter paludis TaxID=2908000 RepID=UPI0023DABEEC|nr:molybdopterin cofactor-binding domain-containing protein [Ramlibacter paludis]MCG2593900.1 molybdopterin-dependent oxidoreductase [Ramlibacter paludis]